MKIIHIFELFVLGAVWGASFLFMKVATPELGVVNIIALRLWVATLFLLPFWYYRYGRKAENWQLIKQNWLNIFVVGLLNSAIPFMLYAYTTYSITGGFASILNSTAAIWGAIVAWIWFSKKPTLNVAIGLCLGVLGVVVLVFDSLSISNIAVSKGVVAGIAAAVMYGFSANFITAKLSNIPPLTLATFSLLFVSILLTIPAWWTFPDTEVSPMAWWSVIALGAPCTGFAYVLYFKLIAQVGVTKAITVAFLVPVFGVYWGAIFLQEIITIEMILGMLMILMGTALVLGFIKIARGK